MTIHDQAHELARAIRESEEYRTYMQAKDKASQNPEITEALNDFREKQFALQKMQLMGEDAGASASAMEQMQNLAQILMRDPLAAEYMQAEIRFTLMVNDVYEILGDVLKSES